jgi:stage II sporulation protein R
MKRLLLAIFLCFGCMICYAGGMQENISENVTRLHIVANSNSDYDQRLKLDVRDNIIKNVKINKYNIENVISETERMVNEYLKEIKAPYGAKVEYKETWFPTKVYGNIALPSGKYMAVNVKLGKAKGENWWCVMFPPLCFTDGATGKINEDGEKYLKETLTKDEYKLISLNDDMKFKFKIIEMFK